MTSCARVKRKAILIDWPADDIRNLKPPADPRVWQMYLDLAPGFMLDFDETGRRTDFTWIDKTHAQARSIDLDHRNLELTISVDRQKIWQGPMEDAGPLIIDLDDSDQHQSRVLTFELGGYADRHMPLIAPDTSNRSAIRLERLCIQGIDVTAVFDKDNTSGGRLFSSNGSYHFHYHTPIYDWLLAQANFLKIAFVYHKPGV